MKEVMRNVWDDVPTVIKRGKVELVGVLTDELAKGIFNFEAKQGLGGTIYGAKTSPIEPLIIRTSKGPKTRIR